MDLTEFWVQEAWELLDEYEPGIVVTETVPSRGAGIPEQLYLANVMVTTVHTIALTEGVNCVQVSARTVQAHIAKRKEGVKITKVQVRNGVLERCPELKPRFKEFVKHFEEPDAIAVGLYYGDTVNQ